MHITLKISAIQEIKHEQTILITPIEKAELMADYEDKKNNPEQLAEGLSNLLNGEPNPPNSRFIDVEIEDVK